MARITTVSEESEAQGPQLQLLQQVKSQYGGVVPGIAQILLADLAIAGPTFQLYHYLNARPDSPLTKLQLQMLATVVNGLIGGKPWLGMHSEAVRRLTHDEHLSSEFATTWSQYDLDPKTRALLGYAQKLTETPSFIDDADFEALRAAGWNQRGIDQATALIAFYNFSGRLEAASGLPPDRFPPEASFPEATPDS